jgi:peptidoglycan/xylan/chitin deacetylase (PgdA/CDA1 family)
VRLETPALSVGVAWIKHLSKRRGKKIFQQAFRMYKFHKTPFEQIIDNILNVVSKYGASYTFPTVASTAAQKPDLLRKIIDAKSEIAAHGYQHVKYPLISAEDQNTDVTRAVASFRKMRIPIKGFRAPYNAYDSNTPAIIEKHGFLWDAGIGYSKENRSKTDFFKLSQSGRELNFVCIPLNELSDDLMIDELQYSANEMVRHLTKALDGAKKAGGVIMFDLHPIRIGQPEYVNVLDRLVSYGTNIGGWFPTVSEAVKAKASGRSWNGRDFCCLLTGDVDNFHFGDYLKRLR